MKIAILSRTQGKVNRGGEIFVEELSKRLSKSNIVDILIGEDSDNFKKIVSGGYDIVMPMNGRIQSLKASTGRLFSSYKLVIGGHSGIGKDDIWNIFVSKPDLFVALTKHQANWAKKWAWGSKVEIIHNGVDLDKFSPHGSKFKFNLPRPIILSVGAFEWYKHHEKTINAVSLLDKGSLVIVGKGSKEGSLTKLAQEKLKGRFTIASFPYEELPQVYRGADIFTLPSWDREAFGIVYLEAMASNLPVVAPNDSSRHEIVGEAGIFVDQTNPKLFSQSLEKALQAKWESKPRKQAEKFSWDTIAKEYEECFLKLI